MDGVCFNRVEVSSLAPCGRDGHKALDYRIARAQATSSMPGIDSPPNILEARIPSHRIDAASQWQYTVTAKK